MIAESADGPGARVVKRSTASGCGCEGGGAAHAPIACFVPTCEPGTTTYELHVGELETWLRSEACEHPGAVELSVGPDGERVAYRCESKTDWYVVYARASLVTDEIPVASEGPLDWAEVPTWEELLAALEVPEPVGRWGFFHEVVRVAATEGRVEIAEKLARAATVVPVESWHAPGWCRAARAASEHPEVAEAFHSDLARIVREDGLSAIDAHMGCGVVASVAPRLLVESPEMASELLVRLATSGDESTAWCAAASAVRADERAGASFIAAMRDTLARDDLDEDQHYDVESLWLTCQFAYEHIAALLAAGDTEAAIETVMVTFDLRRDDRWCDVATTVVADEASASLLLDAVIERVRAEPDRERFDSRERGRRLDCSALAEYLGRRGEARDRRILELMTHTATDEGFDSWWCDTAEALHADDRAELSSRLDEITVEPRTAAESSLSARRRCLSRASGASPEDGG